MNGGTRLSYYNYTTEVNNLHIYLLLVLFYILMLTYLFIIIVNLIIIFIVYLFIIYIS